MLDESSVHPVVRQLKIAMITDTPSPIIDWFIDYCSDIHVIEENVYHQAGGEFIYYRKFPHGIKRVIFFLDKTNMKFWCDNDLYWDVMQAKFMIPHQDAQYVTRFLIDALEGYPGTTLYHMTKHWKMINLLSHDYSIPQRVYLHLQDKITVALINK